MKRITLFSSILMLLLTQSLSAQKYYYDIWDGPQSIGVTVGFTTLFNDPRFIFNENDLQLTGSTQKRLCPNLGITHTGDDRIGNFAYGYELWLNYVQTGASATFLRNSNSYVANIRQQNLQTIETIYFGYILSEQFKLSLSVGFSETFTISSKYEVLENGVQKSLDKYGLILMSNLDNAVSVPIAFNGTYFPTEKLYLKGTLGFNMINFSFANILEKKGVFTTSGEFLIDEKSVQYQNNWKAVFLLLSFGYQWE